MNKKWINRILYWTLGAIVPTVIIYNVGHYLSSGQFFILFLLCLYVYRPLVNIVRLQSLNAIEKKYLWKLFIPGYENRFRPLLWWG
jgi:hypothetical protein